MSIEPAASVPSGSKVALGVLVALVVLSPWPFGSVHLRTTQAIALVSLATAIGAFVWDGRHGQLELPPRAFLWPLLGLWALAAIQLVPLPEGLHRWIAPGSAAVWHPDVAAAAAVLGPGPHSISLYPEATRRWLALATGVVALAVAAAPALRERRPAVRASIAIVGGGLAVAVYGLVARLLFGNKLYGVFTVPTVSPFGPFVSKNHFAGYVEMIALLAVGLATGLADEARHGPGWLSWIESRRSSWVVVAWGAAMVLVLAVPVSLSRGGVVSLGAGLVAFAFVRLWTRSRRGPSPCAALLAAGAALLLVAGSVVVLPGLARDRVLTLTGVTTEQSGAYRLAIWGNSLRLAASSPGVGSGFGAYADAIPRFKTAAGGLRVEHAENDYVEALAEGGAVGAGLIVALVALALATGLRGIGAETHRLPRGLRAGALAGVVAVLVHSTFDFNLRLPSNALLFAALAALALTSNRGAPSSRPARWLPNAIMAAGLVASLFTPWTEARFDSGSLVRVSPGATSALRRTSLEREVAVHLHRRPADAPAWVALAWLRAPSSGTDAAALGSWAVRLDPTSPGVRDAANRFRDQEDFSRP